jgi:hypothetical protein
MDELLALESRWNEQIENFNSQAAVREKEYLQIISEKDNNLELKRKLELEIPSLEKEKEKVKEEITKIEESPDFQKHWSEYCKRKEQFAKQKEVEKKNEWTKLSDSFNNAVNNLDIEEAQALLDKLKILDETRSENLKDKLIEMLKKL